MAYDESLDKRKLREILLNPYAFLAAMSETTQPTLKEDDKAEVTSDETSFSSATKSNIPSAENDPSGWFAASGSVAGPGVKPGGTIPNAERTHPSIGSAATAGGLAAMGAAGLGGLTALAGIPIIGAALGVFGTGAMLYNILKKKEAK